MSETGERRCMGEPFLKGSPMRPPQRLLSSRLGVRLITMRDQMSNMRFSVESALTLSREERGFRLCPLSLWERAGVRVNLARLKVHSYETASTMLLA